MKTIIAGGRDFKDDTLMHNILKNITNITEVTEVTEVVCGGAKGADALGKVWAHNNNIPVKMFPAVWDRYGKSAGYTRNVQMADYADCLIAFWDGKSKGTMHMIKEAKKRKLICHVIMYNQQKQLSQLSLDFN